MKTLDDQEIIDVCMELLREEEASGKQRQQIAKELGKAPSTITKWLDPDNPNYPRGKSLSCILRVYGGGMKPAMVARLIKAFRKKPNTLSNILKIEESQDDETKKAADEMIAHLAARVK